MAHIPTESSTVEPRSVGELSFEEALDELERLTARMTTGDITLRESVEGYERGRALLDRCRAELEAAQEVVERLRPKTS